MEDRDIIDLYWRREQSAIDETQKKYGKWCRKIAYDILRSSRDTEECVNDAYLTAWNSIPPQRPDSLGAWLTKVTRNLCYDRLKLQLAGKRGGGELTLCLDELTECVSSGSSVEQSYEARELVEAINGFLGSLSQKDRLVFMHRYWLMAPCPDIARVMGCSQGAVRLSLFRSRKKLQTYLKSEGFL